MHSSRKTNHDVGWIDAKLKLHQQMLEHSLKLLPKFDCDVLGVK